MTTYISCVETAKLVREALKRAFRSTKFSVRSRHHSAITIAWVDGPTAARVKQIVGKFQGATFDGMIDLESSVTHYVNGQPVQYGSKYIFTDRSHSAKFLKSVAGPVAERYGLPVPEILGSANDAYPRNDHKPIAGGLYSLAELIQDEAARTSATGKTRRKADKATQAGSFRKLAADLTDRIAEKRRPRGWNMTYRRARMDRHREDEARHLELVQDKLLALAAGWDADTLPDCLKMIRTRAQVETLLTNNDMPSLDYEAAAHNRLVAAGIEDDHRFWEARNALLDLGDPRAGQKTQADELAELERAVLLVNLPGFFPTPASVIDRMLLLADIRPEMRVLEPSAGRGDLADAIRKAVPEACVEVIEIASQLRSILERKGYKLVGCDFLEFTEGGYDRVIQNPPFEHFQDIDHVRQAFKVLRPGGRLVSVMCESSFFRSDAKASEFRCWLEQVGGVSEKLPANAFLDSDKPTGVNTRLVVINKSEAPMI
jgi:hypothetical protein